MKWYEKQKQIFDAKKKDTEKEVTKKSAKVEPKNEGIYDLTKGAKIENKNKEKTVELALQKEEVKIEKTVIAKGTSIIGDIETEGDLDFSGVIKGNIVCQGETIVSGMIEGTVSGVNVTLSEAKIVDDINSSGFVSIDEKSYVKGNIVAEDVVINGMINGNVTVRKSLHLKEASKIVGDLFAEEIEIERGAIVQGNIEIKNK